MGQWERLLPHLPCTWKTSPAPKADIVTRYQADNNII